MKRVDRIALIGISPPNELNDVAENPHDEWPGYGVRRIQADIIAGGWGDQIELLVLEYRADDTEALLVELEEFSPDLIGGAAYIWSFQALIDIAKKFKEYRADGLVIFGGPSARVCMMELPQYRDAGEYVDALCLGEGEGVINDVLRLGCTTRGDLAKVPGLSIARRDEWIDTASRDLIMDLDSIASPYQMDLMPHGKWGYLESYRGCPMSCSFCEWGVSSPTNRVFSRDYIAREMEAMKRANVFPGIFHLDAGLNLNARGFREFAGAAKDTGFFNDILFFSHVYPSRIKDEHFDFLSSCHMPVIGLGLQAFDQEVLKAHSRPAKIENFSRVAKELASICKVEIQILFGLPGDTPKGFMHALEFALSLPASVRVFHTLILPDALMTRASPEFDIKFDPHTLKIQSCQGWSEADIERTARELDEITAQDQGGRTDMWWSLNSARTRSITAGH